MAREGKLVCVRDNTLKGEFVEKKKIPDGMEFPSDHVVVSCRFLCSRSEL
jgi:hypothetical protein